MKKTIKILSTLLIIMIASGCNSDDDQPVDTITTLTHQQLQGTWKVTFFKDQVDKTSEYSGYIFTFDLEDGIEVDANGVQVINSSYDIYGAQIDNEQYTILECFFNKGPNATIDGALRELTEQWIVKKVLNNATKIELEERISVNPPEILHLTKI